MSVSLTTLDGVVVNIVPYLQGRMWGFLKAHFRQWDFDQKCFVWDFENSTDAIFPCTYPELIAYNKLLRLGNTTHSYNERELFHMLSLAHKLDDTEGFDNILLHTRHAFFRPDSVALQNTHISDLAIYMVLTSGGRVQKKGLGNHVVSWCVNAIGGEEALARYGRVGVLTRLYTKGISLNFHAIKRGGAKGGQLHVLDWAFQCSPGEDVCDVLYDAVREKRAQVVEWVWDHVGEEWAEFTLDHAVERGVSSIVKFYYAHGLKCSPRALRIAKAKGHHDTIACING